MIMQFRKELAWIVIFFVGLWSLWIFLMSFMFYSYAYRPEAHSFLMWIRYTLTPMIFPCFLFALVPRRWATIPLWVVSISTIALPYLLNAQQKAWLGYWTTSFNHRDTKEIAQIIVIPIATQLAVMLQWRGSRENSSNSSEILR
jgi:glucan phosphoethanolaminetransferase (alkaline phosphatase superfamily)